ncbi:MAG TPA: UDP-glucose/GDP-mannose dehydrogenase family protein [Polyangia bacterium]|jgi:UDPglucose 6-dehydrogenase|nr:UDP-glucose/GDP-mannose dehydrogenase family protein [Polyangia bacterium]
MRLAVLGTGYVGLVAGAGFADFGNEVVCADVDADKIARLGRGELPIYEPGLDRLVERNVREGRLSFTTDIELAVRGGRMGRPGPGTGQAGEAGSLEVGPADAIFIAVGTPAAADGAADLSYVLSAAETIGRALTRWAVIVTKSTVPVGTVEKVRAQVARVTDVPFAVASNPEFLKEGDAINDFMKPDRVIIGTEDLRAREVLRALYAPFVRTNDRMLFMDARSAELTKYAANAMLATRISFMNDIANLCERIGADVEAVRRGMGMDPRIGAKFLFPGIGYGGSCFPKDVKAVLATASEAGSPLEILEAVHRVNERQKGVLAERLAAHFSATGRGLRGRTVALWGLSFKPGTDDIREAPALVILDRLLEQGATVRAFDPVAGPAVAARYAHQHFSDRLILCDSNYEAARGAEALVVCTEWHEFRRPNFMRLKELLAEPTVFDGRNIWDPAELRGLGFKYHGIGRS